MNEYPYVQDLVRKIINGKLLKMTYPNRKGLPIPLAKFKPPEYYDQINAFMKNAAMGINAK